MTLLSEDVLLGTSYALGLMIFFYYGLTAYACVRYFLHEPRRRVRDLVCKGRLPLLGALLLTAVFVRTAIGTLDAACGSGSSVRLSRPARRATRSDAACDTLPHMLHTGVSHQEASVGRSSRQLPPWSLVPVAALAWWLIGFFPSLLEDVLTDRPSGGWPLAPLLASRSGALWMGAFWGGVVAGLLGRLARPGRRRTAVAATGAGVAIAMAVTLLQVGLFIVDQPVPFGADRVIVLLCLLTVVTGVVGWALGSAWVFGPVGLGVGLAALATAVTGWLSGLQLALLNATQGEHLFLGVRGSEWAGAVVLTAALVVIGVRPPARLVWWAVVLVGAWFVAPAFIAAVQFEIVYLWQGGGVPVSEALAAAEQVFWEVARPGASQLVAPWLAAVVVAALVCAALPRFRRPAAG